jgi:ABC-type uncharacterized transport system substrate-binding protein
MLFALCYRAGAQQQGKVPRIGYLSARSAGSVPRSASERFAQGLRELGYIEGKNILIEFRYAEGKPDRFPSLVAELVQLKVDVLVSTETTAISAAKQATLSRALLAPEQWIPNRDQRYTNRIAEFAIKNRLPSIHEGSESVDSGGLMSYGANDAESYKRAAYYVDRILKGAKPADLPVEQPTKFELVINLKTAKQIGLTIPPNVLARADKVIR